MAVRKRGSRWWYDFRIRGVRYRSSIPEARTKAQAEQAEAKIRTEIFEGRYGGRRAGTMSLAKFINEVYLPWARVNKRSAASDHLRARTLLDFFGGRTLAEVSPLLIERYKRERSEMLTKAGTKISAGTVNNELALLSRICTMAVEHGFINANPCARVKRLRTPDMRVRYLSREEEIRLVAALPVIGPARGLVELALHTGMRKSEILSLTWARVDFERGVLLVTNTKTGRDRQVPINSDLRAVLLAAQVRRNGPYVFAGPTGRPYSAAWLHATFKAACSAAGITGLRFHDLRHTAATRMAEAGVSAFNIKAVLGHANIQMTERYAHATTDGMRAAVEALAQKDGHKLVTFRAERKG
jgi:integrase